MSDRRIVWKPDPTAAGRSRMADLIAQAGERFRTSFDGYADFYQWSIDEPEKFWSLIAEFTRVRFRRTPDLVLEAPDRMPGARWFVGSELNFAENMLRNRDDRPAIILRTESGDRSEISFSELYDAVARNAAAMRAVGIGQGDRVVAFMPNHPQAVIAMLAATSIGAIWSSCSPDFGVSGLLDRFGQIEPTILFAADGYSYGGKHFDCLADIAQISRSIDSLRRIVVVPFLNDKPDIKHIQNAQLLDDFVANGRVSEIEFASLPFDHPVYILFSSGTTGVPKCIVHGSGGTLLQHLKEHVIHLDLSPDDRLFYFTTCGWMMWNWLVSGLASGAAIVLYDGSPVYPDAGVLWRLAEDEGVTVFGTSAKYIAALEKSDFRPISEVKLGKLRTILSTGSPLAPESYDFVYSQINNEVQLCSISGGTDIVSCFALGNPIQPVRRGEIQCRGLGMAVEIFDTDAHSVGPGVQGELVCTRPFPSMPIGFWNDPDGSGYRAAYFEKFPGVWAQGDYAELTDSGGIIISGRSDAVLNPGGVRIGTAEIYRQVEKLDEVIESIAIGQQWDNDVRIVLFVVLREGIELDAALEDRIRQVIRANATPRHIPAKILSVPDVPRTRSGKLAELAVRDCVHGVPVTNAQAFSNPDALKFFRDRQELEAD